MLRRESMVNVTSERFSTSMKWSQLAAHIRQYGRSMLSHSLSIIAAMSVIG